MARTRTITTGWTHPETEEEYRVTLSYTPGSPGRTYGEPGDCYPAEGPEIEIVSVVEDKEGGAPRPDLFAAVEAELDGSWGDTVADEAEDDAQDRYAAEMENRADARREERLLGDRW